MKARQKNLIKQIFKAVMILLLVIAVCRFTAGGGAALLVLIAFWGALCGKVGLAISTYCLFPLLIIMNPFILPKTGLNGMIIRVGGLVITMGLMIGAARRHGHHRLPIGGLFIFLLCAVISSMNGYNPIISYLKIGNFLLLMIGFWLGFQNIDKSPNDVEKIRMFLLGMSVFIVMGSFATLAFPGMAYLTTAQSTRMSGMTLQDANAIVNSVNGIKLFAGITNQSQCLAVMLPCSIAWLLCDMLFVEREITLVHTACIVTALPLVYMTRSRVAFLASFVAIVVIYGYCLTRMRVRPDLKRKLRSWMTFGLIAVACACAFVEIRNQSISRWLRKTDDVQADQRGFGEAFTESRMGKVAENMFDFRRNPLLGSGFQVSYDMQFMDMDRGGLILSAPIEKGVLPLMVLGETGVVGLSVFILFLCSFYATCIRKTYYCTLTMMTVLLTTNMAEAMFFSPGGAGGILWVLTIGGGFIIDTIVIFRRRLEAQGALIV